jgi:hypothetical protein
VCFTVLEMLNVSGESQRYFVLFWQPQRCYSDIDRAHNVVMVLLASPRCYLTRVIYKSYNG